MVNNNINNCRNVGIKGTPILAILSTEARVGLIISVICE
jgi:hypothetical protein